MKPVAPTRPAVHKSRILALIAFSFLLAACTKPGFMKGEDESKGTPTMVGVDTQVTPRELLTARLVNPPVDENAPKITVGKLIEFADRYLSCDCSGSRFVRSWTRRAGDYALTTNSDFVRPLNFACRAEGETTNCFLAEIDRGPQVQDLTKRFVPGSEFIQFMYENGLQCDREEPCPALDPTS